ncbi:hypothetical protein A6S26_29055 [Nostoc sp. ATCC 43529]|nr:hypothetical protein A6S26_29055 [Nostoc sp. ATCC 43529]
MGVSRRRILISGVSATGITATLLGKRVQANTQKPLEPKATIDRNGKFASKVVLITGATSGIGEATAYAFARERAKVFFCGRRENLGKQVEKKIKDFRGEGTYMRADVRKEEDVKALIQSCVQKYGRIDIAFNNAGIFMTPAFFAYSLLYLQLHKFQSINFLCGKKLFVTFLALPPVLPLLPLH